MTNIEMFLTNNVSNVPDYKTILVENDGMMQMIDTLQECKYSNHNKVQFKKLGHSRLSQKMQCELLSLNFH